MTRLLITGATGYLGREVVRQAVMEEGHVVWATWHRRPLSAGQSDLQAARLNVVDAAQVWRVFADVQPDVVIHTAYSQEPEDSYAVTALGSRHVAEAAAAAKARLIHVSSDVVFDGEAAPYEETARPAPLHAYGRAKAAAEAFVQRLAPGAAIVRTSLICGLEPMDRASSWVVRSLQQGRSITLFTDELRSPVWVQDLAAALLELASADFAGVMHVAGPQGLSRYDMGCRLARRFGLNPAGITAGLSRNSGLLRPRDCRLNTRLARQRLKTRLRSFDNGLWDGEHGDR